MQLTVEKITLIKKRLKQLKEDKRVMLTIVEEIWSLKWVTMFS